MIQDQLSSGAVLKELTAASVLVRAAPDSPGLVDALTRNLFEVAPGFNWRARRGSTTASSTDVAVLGPLALLGDLGPRAEPAVPVLVKALDAITEGGQYEIARDRRYRGSLEVAQEMIETLGKIGPKAKDALPLLEDLARDRTLKDPPASKLSPGSKSRRIWSPEIRQAAIAAIAKIKDAATKSPEPEEAPKKPPEKSPVMPPKTGGNIQQKSDGSALWRWRRSSITWPRPCTASSHRAQRALLRQHTNPSRLASC